jgi:hypothetical protein
VGNCWQSQFSRVHVANHGWRCFDSAAIQWGAAPARVGCRAASKAAGHSATLFNGLSLSSRLRLFHSPYLTLGHKGEVRACFCRDEARARRCDGANQKFGLKLGYWDICSFQPPGPWPLLTTPGHLCSFLPISAHLRITRDTDTPHTSLAGSWILHWATGSVWQSGSWLHARSSDHFSCDRQRGLAAVQRSVSVLILLNFALANTR